MQLRETLSRVRPEYYFGAIFWTPFWLLPVLSEKGIPSSLVVANIITAIAISAFLEAVANMLGRYRRYFYLAVGIVLWIGAAGFITYAVLERGIISSITLFDASQYTDLVSQQFSKVSAVSQIPFWLIALFIPFVALGYHWRQLDGAANRFYAAALLAVSLLPIPLRYANCMKSRSCDRTTFWRRSVYPLDHYPPVASYYAFDDMLKLRHALAHPPVVGHMTVTANEHQRPLTLIVIVGESMTRNHWSLYGYCRPTTPKLDARAAQLFVFRDVVSTIPMTTIGVPRALTISAHAGQDLESRPSLIDMLNDGGFSTSWISDQLATFLTTSNIVWLAQSAQHKIWLNIGGNSHNYNIQDPFDDSLLAPLSNTLAGHESRKAIFLHVNGDHIPYNVRYPASFNVPALAAASHGRNASQSSLISDYDRAVRYEDDFMEKVLAQLEQNKGDTALVMFSDHGEEVFDQVDWHGHIYPSVTRNMVEIPFFVWLSPSLREHRPELVRALQSAVGKRMQNTDVSATIADIADLTVAGLKPERRPLTAQFRSTPRRNADGDYDVDPNFGVTPTLPPLCPAPHS